MRKFCFPIRGRDRDRDAVARDPRSRRSGFGGRFQDGDGNLVVA